MLGDAPAHYVYADYRDVAGLKLPHKVTVQKLGQSYSEVQYSSASVNDDAADATFDQRTKRAVEQYGTFVELWKRADPDLQPRVTEARARLERLRRGLQ